MSNAKQGEPESQTAFEKRITEESQRQGHVEYPKMLHHTDGSNITVNSKAEEDATLSKGHYHPTPDAALKEKEKRDAKDKK